MIPMYDTKLFTDFWSTADAFKDAYDASTLSGAITDDNCLKLWALLFAKYGNNPVANYDETQFAYKVWAIIFQFGPTWQTRLNLQEKIRNLSDDDLLAGSGAIYNHAFNPSTLPSQEELAYINEQNTTKYKRSKVEGYQVQWEMLRTDVTEQFLENFKPLFKTVVYPQVTHIYATEEDD